MAKSITTGTMAQTTDAEFRAWVTEFDALMTGPLGLIATSDTGQINLSTVLKPAAASASQGFRMYKTADGLADLYIKVEFGSAGAANQPGIFITVGTSTDGAGTVTGVFGARQTASGNAPTAGTWSRFANGKTGLWWIQFHKGSSQPNVGFFLARTVSAAGSPTSEGWVLYTANGSSFAAQVVRVLPTPQAWSASREFALIPYSSTDGMSGDRPMVFGHQLALPDVRPVPAAVSYFGSTISEGVPFTIPVLGSARTYMPLGNYSPTRNAGSGAPSGQVYLALEW